MKRQNRFRFVELLFAAIAALLMQSCERLLDAFDERDVVIQPNENNTNRFNYFSLDIDNDNQIDFVSEYFREEMGEKTLEGYFLKPVEGVYVFSQGKIEDGTFSQKYDLSNMPILHTYSEGDTIARGLEQVVYPIDLYHGRRHIAFYMEYITNGSGLGPWQGPLIAQEPETVYLGVSKQSAAGIFFGWIELRCSPQILMFPKDDARYDSQYEITDYYLSSEQGKPAIVGKK